MRFLSSCGVFFVLLLACGDDAAMPDSGDAADAGSDTEPDLDADTGSDSGVSCGTLECDRNAECVDLACVCLDGFEGDGSTCTDIDECAVGAADCAEDAVCTNTSGAFECACAEGYEGDGVRCMDIDECAEESDDCVALGGVCTNTEGAFECSCAEGFEGDGRECADVAAPVVRVTFPVLTSYTEGEQITIRGEVDDNAGIASVTIDGEGAESDDAFLRWRLQVDVEDTMNVYEVRATDDAGNESEPVQVRVGRTPEGFLSLRYMDVDPEDPTRIFVASSEEFYEVDLVAREAREIGRSIRTQDMVYDPEGERLLINQGYTDVVAMDVSTGTVTPLSTTTMPDGTFPFGSLRKLAVDSSGGQLLATDSSAIMGRPGVMAVDLTTGRRRHLSGRGLPSPTPFYTAGEVIVADPDGAFAGVLDQGGGGADYSILRVDIATGAQTEVVTGLRFFDALATDGDVFFYPDAAGNLLQVPTAGGASTLAIRPPARVTLGVMRPSAEEGHLLSSVFSRAVGVLDFDLEAQTSEWLFSDMLPGDAWIAWAGALTEPVDGHVYFDVNEPSALGRLNLDTGEQDVLTLSTTGTAAYGGGSLAADAARNRVIAVSCDGDSGEVLEIDVATRSVSLLGEGEVNVCTNEAVAVIDDQLLVWNQDDALVRVSLESGERSLLDLADTRVDGFDLSALVADAPGGQVLLVGSAVPDRTPLLLSVDAMSGEVSVLLDGVAGVLLRDVFAADEGIYVRRETGSGFVRVSREGMVEEISFEVRDDGEANPLIVRAGESSAPMHYQGCAFFLERNGRLVQVHLESSERAAVVEVLGSRRSGAG